MQPVLHSLPQAAVVLCCTTLFTRRYDSVGTAALSKYDRRDARLWIV